MRQTLFPNKGLFEIRSMGGKSYCPPTVPSPIIVFDEASPLFSTEKRERTIFHLNEALHSEVCKHCLGTGKIISTMFGIMPCFYCNEAGHVKKCTCGSGIKIGKNESFCIMCKPRPEPDLKILLNERTWFELLASTSRNV